MPSQKFDINLDFFILRNSLKYDSGLELSSYT